MNRTQLTAFAAVAEAGGFTRGAEMLLVSQPAVSLQVSELEAALGTKLFDRLPRGVRLTAAGELLLGYARRIDALEKEAEAAVADLLGLGRGRLAIGASLTVGSYLLPPVLGRFRREHPNVALDVQIANSTHVEAMLADGRIDLAFTEGLSHGPAFVAETVATDRLVPIAPPDHPLARKRSVSLATLVREPLIGREAGSGTRQVVDAALAGRGVIPGPTLTLGSTEAIKGAVAAGVGVAFVSELAVAGEVAVGTLAVVRVKDLTITRPLSVLRVPGRTDSPAAVAFVGMVRKSRRGATSGPLSRVPTGEG